MSSNHEMTASIYEHSAQILEQLCSDSGEYTRYLLTISILQEDIYKKYYSDSSHHNFVRQLRALAGAPLPSFPYSMRQGAIAVTAACTGESSGYAVQAGSCEEPFFIFRMVGGKLSIDSRCWHPPGVWY